MPSEIPTLQFLTSSTPKSHPWGMTQATKWNSVQYVFYLSHKVKNLWNWPSNWNLIFDLLTPQGHQFDTRVKILLAFCSACHHRQFDMPHDHVRKYFLTHWAPLAPKVLPVGHDAGDRMKITFDMFYIFCLICFISFICEDIRNVWYNTLKLTL